MDIMTIVGWGLGLGALLYAVGTSQASAFFMNKNAIILVLGGTLGATLITYPWSLLKRVPRAMSIFIFPGRRERATEMMEALVRLTTQAKAYGPDSLQAEFGNMKSRFLVDGLKMIIDGLPPNSVRESLLKDIHFTRVRHSEVANLFRNMATYAPIFGLLGTLVGVVEVLQNLSDPATMGVHMALAMTATFYGIFSANFVFLPIAGKLQAYSEHELFLKEVMIEGIMAIQKGEVPSILSRKLQAYLSNGTRRPTVKGAVKEPGKGAKTPQPLHKR